MSHFCNLRLLININLSIFNWNYRCVLKLMSFKICLKLYVHSYISIILRVDLRKSYVQKCEYFFYLLKRSSFWKKNVRKRYAQKTCIHSLLKLIPGPACLMLPDKEYIYIVLLLLAPLLMSNVTESVFEQICVNNLSV